MIPKAHRFAALSPSLAPHNLLPPLGSPVPALLLQYRSPSQLGALFWLSLSLSLALMGFK